MAKAVRQVSIYVTAGEVREKIAGMRAASLQNALETQAADSPIGFLAGYAVPGIASWAISGAHLQLFEEGALGGLTMEASQARLRDLQRNRAALEVEFETADGDTQGGTALISQLSVEAAFGDVLQGGFQLVGIGAISDTESGTGGSEDEDPVEPGTLLTPQRLTVTAVGETSVSLAWDSVPNADGYVVHYGTTQGGPYGQSNQIPVGNLSNPSEPTWTVQGLTTGTTYYFVVSTYTPSDAEVLPTAPTWDPAEPDMITIDAA